MKLLLKLGILVNLIICSTPFFNRRPEKDSCLVSPRPKNLDYIFYALSQFNA